MGSPVQILPATRYEEAKLLSRVDIIPNFRLDVWQRDTVLESPKGEGSAKNMNS
jgi:hypothetical protein